MKYNLNNPIDQKKFKDYCNSLFKKRGYVELREIKPATSQQQNKYLHVILGYFALNYGETLEYIKQEIFKKSVNPDIFRTEYINKKTGEVREDWISTSALDSKDMTESIDRFRTWSSKEAGIYLPDANETDFLREAEIEIERVKQYL